MNALSKLMLAAALLAPAVMPTAALAHGRAEETKTLELGKPIDFAPGFLPAHVTCDDVEVVKVEDVGESFKITGLKLGSTACSFQQDVKGGQRRLLHFTVVPANPAK